MVRTTGCPTYSTISPHRVAAGSALNGIAAGYITSNRSRAHARARTHKSRLLRQSLVAPGRGRRGIDGLQLLLRGAASSAIGLHREIFFGGGNLSNSSPGRKRSGSSLGTRE